MAGKVNKLKEAPWTILFCYYWLPPLLLTAGILLMAGELGSVSNYTIVVRILRIFLPSYSLAELYKIYFFLRKLGHFLAYALLFAAYVRAWRWHLGKTRLNAVLLTLGLCFLVAAADETRQSFHSSRTGSPGDVILDMSGALTAALVLFPFLREQADQDDVAGSGPP
jgi:VanZ family protein